MAYGGGRAFASVFRAMGVDADVVPPSDDHEKLSCGRPGELEAGSPITNCWQAKDFSFPVDFFRN
jgi:hypothetical protein